MFHISAPFTFNNRHYQTMENQMKTFFDMAMEMEEETTRKHIAEATGISFDPKDYKASKEVWAPC